MRLPLDYNGDLGLSKPHYRPFSELADHAGTMVSFAARSLLTRASDDDEQGIDCSKESNKSDSRCETPASRANTQTLAIALGAA